jgi:chromosome segregation ATPase
MEPNWPNIALLTLFLFALTVVWGAWNGWFSPVAPPSIDISATWETEKKTMQEALQRAKDQLFRYENTVPQLDASLSDAGDTSQALMNDIQQLTARLNQLEAENATLRQGLKEALADLARAREMLMECKARMDSARLERQYCTQEVPSNVLY